MTILLTALISTTAYLGILIYYDYTHGDFKNKNVRYYAILLNGEKIGYSTHTRITLDGNVKTIETNSIEIVRGKSKGRMYIEQSCLETSDGIPIEFVYHSKIGGQEIKHRGTILDQKCNLEIHKFDGSIEKKQMNWERNWLLSEGLRLKRMSAIKNNYAHYTAELFEPANLKAYTNVIELKKSNNNLSKMIVTSKSSTGDRSRVYFFDDKYYPVKISLALMGMECDIVRCSRKYALSSNSKDDILKNISIKPVLNGACPKSQKASYKISFDNDMTIEIPSNETQAVQSYPNGLFLVTIYTIQMPIGGDFPYNETDKKLLESLKSNKILQVKKAFYLAKKVIGNTTCTSEAVEKIVAFVYDYINRKNTNSEYLSTTQIMNLRRGDCSEHAVLTAAMLRSLGIPAQVATGIVLEHNFSDGNDLKFVPHVWNRVFVKDQWVNVDAYNVNRFKKSNGFTSGHIAFSYSDGMPGNLFFPQRKFKIERVAN